MTRRTPKILVIALPVLGDVLLSTPLISAIRRAWPRAAIDVLTRPGGGEILEGNPDVSEVIELPRKPRAGALLRFLLGHFRRYDQVFSNSASDRALVYGLVLGRRASSLVVDGHRNRRLKERLYRRTVLIDYSRNHTIVQNLMLLPEEHRRRPEVTLPTRSDSAQRLSAVLGEAWRRAPYAVVHPNSAVALKRWHRPGWLDVVGHLQNRGLRVLVSGGPGDAERRYAEDELGLADTGAESLVGRLSLADVAYLLAGCHVYVGVDTVVTHMAAAAGAPTIALFGPANAVNWGPWPEGIDAAESPWEEHGSQQCGNVHIVQGPSCGVGCGRSRCERSARGTGLCLDDLRSDAVITAVDRMLGPVKVAAVS